MSDRRPIKGTYADSGILRKAKPQHTADPHLDDLLVFGYACKIFRDNDRASEIDHGKHLIPWMNDHSLKIDRYDVRATLSDIRPHEPPPGGYSDRMASLTAAEQRAEQLCEEERYLSLYNNDVEEEMYKDEELKRLHKQRSSTYGQVAFDYDAKQSQAESKPATQEQTVEEEPDTPYQSNPRFYVPPDIELPDSMKLHAVIEKTAKFIATQGPQMEILIKAKQSNNLQFEFLNINNRLNRYYKHLLNAVKHGFYPAEEPDIEPPQPEVPTTTSPVVEEQPAIVVPQIRYKPSADCSYTQLISKIKGVPIPAATNGSGNALYGVSEKFSTDTSFQHIMEYRNKMLLNAEVHAKTQSATSNASKPASSDTFVGRKPAAPLLATPISGRVALPKAKVVPPKIVPATAEVKKISTGLMLAQCYNSETDDEEDDEEDETKIKPNVAPVTESAVVYDFPVPEPELRNIIDKTAAYVLKNGKEFEEILRTKNDERFAFLKYTDKHYRYYVHKVTGAICSAPLPAKPTEDEATKTNGVSSSKNSKEQPNEIPSKNTTSVSFSIKPKDDVPLMPAVLREASSDEENVASPPKSPVKPVVQVLPANPLIPALLPTPLPTTTSVTPSTVPIPSLPCEGFTSIYAPDSRPHSPLLQVSPVNLELTDSTIRDAILDEKPNTNGQSEAIKEAKRAEERVKDRLAQVARDKLGQVTKDKQLQLERRKKAMAFLNQIKPIEKESVVVVPTITPEPEVVKPSVVTVAAKSPDSKPPVFVAEVQAKEVESVEQDKEQASKIVENHREGSVISVHSEDSSPERPALIIENGGIVSDDEDDAEVVPRKRSRKHSRSPSKSSSSKRHKSKKSKHRHHHAKKSKSSSRRSRSVIRSRSNSADRESSRRRRRSRSHSSKRSRNVEASYHHKSSSSKKHRHRDRDYD